MKHIIILLFLIAILVWAPTSSADVYSWTDQDGVKHFGQQPPENAQNVKLVFKEEPHDAAADQQRTDAQNQELNQLIRDLEEEEQRQAAESRQKAAETASKQPSSQEDRVSAERARLEAKIAELIERPLDYYGSERNKRARIGYYRYRLEALNSNPEKYFQNPVPFEGNVKNSEQ